MSSRHLLAIGWTLAILAACSIPGRDIPSVGIMQFDKVVHFSMFVVFGLVWLWALQRSHWANRWWVLIAGIAYAIATEIYQGFLPFERTPDPWDSLANTLGLLTALALYQVYWKSRRRGQTA